MLRFRYTVPIITDRRSLVFKIYFFMRLGHKDLLVQPLPM